MLSRALKVGNGALVIPVSKFLINPSIYNPRDEITIP